MTPEELEDIRRRAKERCGAEGGIPKDDYTLKLCDEVERLQTNALTDIPALVAVIKRLQREAREALEVARRFGGIDGNHHKNWVIDQMVRELTGPDYQDFVRRAKTGGYDWDEGIAP